ncbi:TMEM165/GDT1 family protein [Almyronema epifaneia]|uniref:GDT1 family protein n=1 Tax=Almyronema epifaneia S1 TaxID=2991925 RepID=A0ABW6IAF0_9CYAN
MLTGFTAGLLLISISELGDKTFFIGAILAMRHPRRWVFLGVTAALFVMTLLSVLLGQVATFLPPHYVQWAAVALFLGFGLKLLYDASRMKDQGLAHEQAEALETVNRQEQHITQWSVSSVLTEAFLLTFVAEWGDRTQIATITLAAANHPVGITLGATLGHAICAAIAVVSGKFVAGRLSERWLTTAGGVLFLIFGLVAALEP